MKSRTREIVIKSSNKIIIIAIIIIIIINKTGSEQLYKALSLSLSLSLSHNATPQTSALEVPDDGDELEDGLAAVEDAAAGLGLAVTMELESRE